MPVNKFIKYDLPLSNIIWHFSIYFMLDSGYFLKDIGLVSSRKNLVFVGQICLIVCRAPNIFLTGKHSFSNQAFLIDSRHTGDFIDFIISFVLVNKHNGFVKRHASLFVPSMQFATSFFDIICESRMCFTSATFLQLDTTKQNRN